MERKVSTAMLWGDGMYAHHLMSTLLTLVKYGLDTGPNAFILETQHIYPLIITIQTSLPRPALPFTPGDPKSRIRIPKKTCLNSPEDLLSIST
ncbi:hypothetical protein OCU04_007785 [Sclerotinia nivalis]|uniref:Uncharacterized protein n=1 Tax=Sclerotinia nivalis TaxID=352851 RepID=A0A9X0AJH9_9HELO|nr:hypothetical protein OCU04_007785 [Sclerotinia nivalis]